MRIDSSQLYLFIPASATRPKSHRIFSLRPLSRGGEQGAHSLAKTDLLKNKKFVRASCFVQEAWDQTYFAVWPRFEARPNEQYLSMTRDACQLISSSIFWRGAEECVFSRENPFFRGEKYRENNLRRRGTRARKIFIFARKRAAHGARTSGRGESFSVERSCAGMITSRGAASCASRIARAFHAKLETSTTNVRSGRAESKTLS